MTAASEFPPGMVKVTAKEFFAALYKDPRDIMPSIRDPEVTSWEVRATREVWGQSLPGWRARGNPNVPTVWMLTKSAAKQGV